MTRHRAEVRPRYGRIVALGISVVVTGISVLGGIGLLPRGAAQSAAGAEDSLSVPGNASSARGGEAEDTAALAANETDASDQSQERGSSESSEPSGQTPAVPPVRKARAARSDVTREMLDDVSLPDGSGSGRRVVFSEDRQRVWLVDADDDVRRTYLVSGSVYDNLDPGTYSVYSRSEHAYGIDDSGTMNWFVRFTRGDNAAIGFHDIPVLDGDPLQPASDLGTPQSHGCIRQKESDAKALWRFAPLGTTVVVV